MPGDMNQLMQQAMQMQAEMQRQREELLEQTFEGSAGGGVVTAVVRGDGTLDRVTIDPDVLDDAEMLGDLVVAAVNAALGALNEAATEGLGALGGMDLGGLLG
jgi:DNA-binding YbaB/EbfC family protein